MRSRTFLLGGLVVTVLVVAYEVGRSGTQPDAADAPPTADALLAVAPGLLPRFVGESASSEASDPAPRLVARPGPTRLARRHAARIRAIADREGVEVAAVERAATALPLSEEERRRALEIVIRFQTERQAIFDAAPADREALDRAGGRLRDAIERKRRELEASLGEQRLAKLHAIEREEMNRFLVAAHPAPTAK